MASSLPAWGRFALGASLPVLSLAASLPLVTLPSPALAAESAKDVASRIEAVTVYPDRALVSRTAHLQLTPGTHVLRFTRLPIGLAADSLRVRGAGSADVLIHGFEVETAYLGRSPDARVAVLERQLVSLKDRDRALSDARTIHQRQLDLLASTSGLSGESLAKQLALGKAKIADWRELIGFLDAQQSQEASAIRGIDQTRRTLASERKGVEAELAKLRGFRPQEVRQVPVTVEVGSSGSLDLTLDYVMENASWSPSYDARLAPGGEQLDWRYYAQVQQQTGENWDGVALHLSTAAPALASTPPELPDWFLQPLRPMPRAQAYDMAPGGAMPMPAPKMAARAAESNASREPVATVTDQGVSVTLDVPGRQVIPSDGQPHQSAIGRASFPTKSSYVVYPRLSLDSYLSLEAKQTGPWPLLPGPIKGFVGQDYVGTTPLVSDVMPGETLDLRMGTDRSIRTTRKRLSKTEGESGLIGKVRYAEYRYEVSVANFKPAAQTVTVIEPIPQSTDENVRVTLESSSYAPLPDSPPGQVRWRFKLAPSEKKVLRWGYRVEYPLSMRLSGLE